MIVNQKIAICIPALNEEKTIGQTIKIIDQGLTDFRDDFKKIIVVVDNHSEDKTKEISLKTKTAADKYYLSTAKGQLGKGRNLINFFKFCQKHSIDYAATIDADIRTLKSDWVKKLIDPLINKQADFVAPLYKRSRFEGSTTNNFAFPLIFACFGKEIRQPIGGEFAFSRKAYQQFIRCSKNPAVYQYGIDIFLTMTALSSRNKIKEAILGRKLHNPSFPNMVMMSKQVMSSAFYQLKNSRLNLSGNLSLKTKKNLNIINKVPFAHKKEAQKLLEENIIILQKNLDSYKNFISLNKIQDVIKNKNVTNEEWSVILAEFITKAINGQLAEKLSTLLSPIFVIRAVSFWSRSEKMAARQTEEEIYKITNLTRKRLIDFQLTQH